MLKRKLVILLAMLVAAAMLITACGGSQTPAPASSQPAASSQPQKSEAAKPAAGAVVFKLGHGQNLESAAHKSIVKFAEEVKQKSNGSIDVQVFPANQLGNERDLAEGLTMGTIDMAWISAGVMENFEPKFAVFSLPYVIRDYAHVHQVTEGDAGKAIFDSLLKNKNVRTLGFYDQGFRFIWNNVQPITKMEDLKGMKIRSPESPVYMGTLKLLGTNPTPMPWGEVYTSVQTKVVAGLEVHPESFLTSKLYEVCKFGSVTRHIYAGSVFMINEDKFKKLTKEQQDLISAAAVSSEKFNRDLIVKSEAQFIKDCNDKGTKINEIAEPEMQKFRDAVKPLYNDYAAKVGGMDFINKVINTGK